MINPERLNNMQKNTVRIIGGEWRSRKLPVPDVNGLRPTPDRVRETLFNWLAPVIAGARCLDLFAGSGVLGFEALSRGASYAMLIDNAADVIKTLQEQKIKLNAQQADIYQAKIPEQLPSAKQSFDIVFLDPPYQLNLVMPCCHYLEEHEFLADNAYIYLEDKQIIKDNDLPSNWKIIKSNQAGQVFYHLALREREKK